MRTRETITGGFTELQTRYHDNGSGPIPDYESYTGAREVKSIEDVVTPGFFSLKKCGKFLPLNPVLIDTQVEIRSPGPVSYENLASGGIGSGSIWVSESPEIDFRSPDELLTDAAVLAAAANAASSKFDLYTFIGEFRSTVDTMAQIGRTFNLSTAQMARKAAEFRRNPWKKFRELWLLGRYGIRPIVYDFANAAEALRALQQDLTIVEGRGNQQENHAEDFDSGFQIVDGYWERRVRENLSQRFRHRGWSAVQFGEPSNVAIGKQPLVTAWELTPWSFVVDWFIDIGAWVQTLQPRLSGDYLGVMFSVKEELTWRQTVEYRGRSGVVSGFMGPSSTEIRRTKYLRGPTTIPFPPVLPELTLPKVVDLMALFIRGRRNVEKILNRR